MPVTTRLSADRDESWWSRCDFAERDLPSEAPTVSRRRDPAARAAARSPRQARARAEPNAVGAVRAGALSREPARGRRQRAVGLPRRRARRRPRMCAPATRASTRASARAASTGAARTSRRARPTRSAGVTPTAWRGTTARACSCRSRRAAAGAVQDFGGRVDAETKAMKMPGRRDDGRPRLRARGAAPPGDRRAGRRRRRRRRFAGSGCCTRYAPLRSLLPPLAPVADRASVGGGAQAEQMCPAFVVTFDVPLPDDASNPAAPCSGRRRRR